MAESFAQHQRLPCFPSKLVEPRVLFLKVPKEHRRLQGLPRHGGHQLVPRRVERPNRVDLERSDGGRAQRRRCLLLLLSPLPLSFSLKQPPQNRARNITAVVARRAAVAVQKTSAATTRLLPEPLPERREAPRGDVGVERRKRLLRAGVELGGVGGAEGVGWEVPCEESGGWVWMR